MNNTNQFLLIPVMPNRQFAPRILLNKLKYLNLSLCSLMIYKHCYLFAAMIRDSNNVVHPIRNLRVIIHDMNAVQPPSTLLSQKLLNDAVSNALPQSTSSADILPNTIVTVGNHDLQLSGKNVFMVRIFHVMIFVCHHLSAIQSLSISGAAMLLH